MSGLFDRFPNLQLYFAENQIGWVPIYLEQMDHNYQRHRHWAEKIYQQYISWGFFDDPVGIKLRDEVGVDKIMWGGDFPHVESDWPRSSEHLSKRSRACRTTNRPKSSREMRSAFCISTMDGTFSSISETGEQHV